MERGAAKGSGAHRTRSCTRRARVDDTAARGHQLMEPFRYLALYSAALPVGARQRRPLPVLPSLSDHNFHLTAGQVETPMLTLPQLYTAGVDCGHMQARLELKRRVADVNAQLNEFRAVRDKAQVDREQ